MGAVFKREMKAYFTSPIAYIFITAFFLYTGKTRFYTGSFFFICHTSPDCCIGNTSGFPPDV